MSGLSFKNIHSSQFDLIMKSLDRTVLPPLIHREITVPGKHGRYDFGKNKYDNRLIPVRFSSVNRDLGSLRKRIRDIAGWLYGEGRLKFDDEPDKYYQAKIYDSIALEQFASLGVFDVTFECEPFAYSETNTQEVTRTDKTPIFVVNSGTIETPQEITITNTGNKTINGFRIKIIKDRS